MEISLIILISYLLGSIPFGFLLTKIILKKDIREIGSGNIGATNVLRTGNKIIGYSTLILDILKAVIKTQSPEFIFISSLAVFLGHVFPIWLKFNGGKGVATYVGILFCINYILGFFFIATWLVVFFIFKYSSLSSLLASLIIPIYYFFIDTENYYFFIIMFILIFYTHRENIKRLKNNTESKTKIY